MEPELFLFGYLCGPVKDRRYGSGTVALVQDYRRKLVWDDYNIRMDRDSCWLPA